MTPELELVTSPEFVAEIGGRDMDELRAMRSRCQALENSLSYVRRLIQGRLDIIGGELQRRRGGGESGDTGDLIGRLPEILSERSRVDSGPGSVRPPVSMEPDPEVTRRLEAMLDQIVSPDDLGRTTDLTTEQLARVVTEFQKIEDQVSNHRRTMHGVIDTLQAEVTRRYRSGEATVDSLLRS